MKVLAGSTGLRSLLFGTFISLSVSSMAQNQPPNHVILPNPTPREPDLKQVFGDTPEEREKQQAMLLQSQLRAREIWLESNQILLLAQQLQEAILSPKKSVSLEADAAKAGQIEKLARSVQQKMKAK